VILGGAGALLAGTTLTACEEAAPPPPPVDPANPLRVDPAAPLDVVVYAGGYGTAYADFDADLYRKKHTGSQLRVSPTQLIGSAIRPRFESGQPPDVVHNAGPERMSSGRLVADGRLADLTPLLDAPSWDIPGKTVRQTLAPGTVESGSYEGVPRALNYVSTVYAFWYSAKLFERHGWAPPRTWADLVRTCTDMKAAGIAPFSFAGKYPYYIYVPLLTLVAKTGGVEVMRAVDNLEDGVWKSESMLRAATAFHELKLKGLVPARTKDLDHLQSQTEFVRSKVGFLPCGSWLESEMRAATPKNFGLTACAVPALDGSAKAPNAVRVAAEESFLVGEKAVNRRGGLEFLRAMLSKAGAAQFSRTTGSLTVVNGAADGLDTSTALSSASELVNLAGDQVVNWYFDDWYAQLARAVEDATAALMAGAIKPAEWTERMQRTADTVKQDTSIKKFQR
jgi:N-acetylglucosamine transport system substrate-binding protein